MVGRSAGERRAARVHRARGVHYVTRGAPIPRRVTNCTLQVHKVTRALADEGSCDELHRLGAQRDTRPLKPEACHFPRALHAQVTRGPQPRGVYFRVLYMRGDAPPAAPRVTKRIPHSRPDPPLTSRRSPLTRHRSRAATQPGTAICAIHRLAALAQDPHRRADAARDPDLGVAIGAVDAAATALNRGR